MNYLKYKLCAVVATIGFVVTPATSLYADPDPAPEAVPSSKIEESRRKVEEPSLGPKQSEVDALGTAGEVVEDVRSGNWRHAVAGLLTLLMLGLAKARDKTAWFSGDRAGAALVIGLGLAGAIATALYGAATIDLKLFAGALGVIAESAGFYVVAKKLIFPSDKVGA